MTRLVGMLLVALLASALFLVQTAYESRRLFAAIEHAKDEGRKLDSEYKRFDAERQAQATHLRVEKVARDRLQMRTVTPAVTHYVVDGPAALASNGAPPPLPGAVASAEGVK